MKQKGVIAFISVLIITLVAAAIMVDVAFDHQVDVRRTSRALAEQQAFLLALSTEQYYIDVLKQETKPPLIPGTTLNTLAYDGLDENWALALPFLPVNNGQLSARLIDLHSRVNLNNLSTIASWPPNNVFSNALAGGNSAMLWGFLFEDIINGSLEVPLFPSVIPAMIDWFDADLQERIDGAEDLFYQQPDYNYRSANTRLSDISELNLIKGMSTTLIEPVEDLFSVVPLPPVTGSSVPTNNIIQLNVNTIEERLLAWLVIAASVNSLSIDDQEREVQILLENRPFEDVNDFLGLIAPVVPPPPGSTGADPSALRRAAIINMIGIKSSYFLLETDIQLGDIALQVKSWIRRDLSGLNFSVFRREMKRLPQYVPPPPPDREDATEDV